MKQKLVNWTLKLVFHFNKHCDRDILKLDCVAD